MTKVQTWNEAKEILESLGLSKKIMNNALQQFETLLAPKKAGGKSRPEPKVIDGITYYYCRFSDAYYPTEEMVYQNAEKREALEDKGYSHIGMSLWTKGQRFIKDGEKRATEINFGIKTKYEISEDETLTGDDLREYAIKLYKEIVALKEENKPNNAQWLVEQFATDEQLSLIENGRI